jgi:hypothetical protein
MAMVMNQNARKPLASGPILSMGVAPAGVGGMPGKPVLTFDIGRVRIFLAEAEWRDLSAAFSRLAGE